MSEFRKDNHFVPRMYLRQWSRDGNTLQMYRILVSHENVPLWKRASISGVAKHEHLYTRIAAGENSDDFERWMAQDFETPATASIDRVIADKRLTRDDWWNLVRFLAAQDVRTPARLVESLPRMQKNMSAFIQDVTNDAARELGRGRASSRSSSSALPRARNPFADRLPIRVSITTDPDGEGALLKVETEVGRGTWHFQMGILLTSTVRALHKHKWSIMTPPDGIEWLTSDDPVIKLNYGALDGNIFGGGWGSKGSEILLPLGPKHLMYTRIGFGDSRRRIALDRQEALRIREVIARHAHRAVFSTEPSDDVPLIMPRTVSAELATAERAQWESWNESLAPPTAANSDESTPVESMPKKEG